MTILPPPPPPTGLSAGNPGDEPADAALGRAVATLRHLPEVPPGAVDRVVAAAVARNGVAGRRSVAATWLARAAVVALAAGLGAVSATVVIGRGQGGGERARTVATADSVAPTLAAAPTVATAATPETATPPAYQPILSSTIGRTAAALAEDRPVPTPFMLARRDARRVAVVGDFNGWNPAANAMTADARGVWTTTVPLPPGRHAYAFVVDGAVWVTDPRAPVVRDADYGRDQSVVLVGHP